MNARQYVALYKHVKAQAATYQVSHPELTSDNLPFPVVEVMSRLFLELKSCPNNYVDKLEELDRTWHKICQLLPTENLIPDGFAKYVRFRSAVVYNTWLLTIYARKVYDNRIARSEQNAKRNSRS